jgi:nicotinamide-nucleotide adenylyltransferase
LLFLFSTHNADKAPSPASFTQRIAMMIMCAEDLQVDPKHEAKVPIDIGLTTAPYYTDKSLAIVNQTPKTYTSDPTHVHLLGYDTLTRFLAPKYYKDCNPPLSALSPFFDAGHKLLVLLRPDSSSDNAVTGDSEAEQRKYISDLAKGSLASEGMKTEWASQISILDGERVSEAAGVSSTVIRKAAKQEDWRVVEDLCTPGVAAWIKDLRLYEGDSSGPKMA